MMKDLSTFSIVFLVTYITYYLGCFPSVPGGDSGELLTEACQLGTARKYEVYQTQNIMTKFIEFLINNIPIPLIY